MLLKCRLCPQMFKSLLIPQEKALIEIVKDVGEHFSKHHQAALQTYVMEIGALARALDATLLSKRLIEIPESEVFAQSVADGAEKIILNALGIDDNELEDDKGQSKKPSNKL
jgi:hypothetical protein